MANRWLLQRRRHVRVRRLAQPRILRMRGSATSGLYDFSDINSSHMSSFDTSLSSSTLAGISSTTEAARKRRIKGFRFDASCKNLFTKKKKNNRISKQHISTYNYYHWIIISWKFVSRKLIGIHVLHLHLPIFFFYYYCSYICTRELF